MLSSIFALFSAITHDNWEDEPDCGNGAAPDHLLPGGVFLDEQLPHQARGALPVYEEYCSQCKMIKATPVRPGAAKL